MNLFRAGYLLETVGCSLPQYDSYHWTVSSSFAQDAPYETICKDLNHTVLVQDFDRFTLNASALRSVYNVSVRETICHYNEIHRNQAAEAPDKAPRLGPSEPLPLGSRLSADYVRISCSARGRTLFAEYFFVPRLKHPKRQDADTNEASSQGESPMSILILGIDATSRMNFHRHMTMTTKYLTEELHAFEFLAFNKVGDNSSPNLFPFLTGMSFHDAESLYRRAERFDDFPLVWNPYKRKGYTTLFFEEAPDWGLFTYPNFTGFSSTPVDYYAVPIMRLMDNPNVSRYCMGSRLKTKVLIKYLGEVLKLNRNKPMFSYTWLVYATHDHVKGLKLIDEPIEALLRELSAYGVLDNTALFMMSDHGFRMDGFRATEIGRYEDKNPFFFLVLPKRFLADYPAAVTHLEVNQRRLVTHYDLHATLLDLSKLPTLDASATKNGLSLFGRVPPERTCANASIAPQFCSCLGASTRFNDDEVAASFSRYAVSYINALAQLHFNDSCVVWEFDSFDEASLLGGSVNSELTIRVMITTRPKAIFEVYGALHNISSWEKHVDFVQRLDRYANTTTCLPQSKWQSMCMCKPELLEASSVL
ncbi:hypothetical protein V5799_005902 [Amblyomma americanum]|uniref:Uncharacterized protein n=1 Tax=Amblyomma americanum TaxID=6943 RepID=A0AAQ4DXX7_AMBAM